MGLIRVSSSLVVRRRRIFPTLHLCRLFPISLAHSPTSLSLASVLFSSHFTCHFVLEDVPDVDIVLKLSDILTALLVGFVLCFGFNFWDIVAFPSAPTSIRYSINDWLAVEDSELATEICLAFGVEDVLTGVLQGAIPNKRGLNLDGTFVTGALEAMVSCDWETFVEDGVTAGAGNTIRVKWTKIAGP